MASGLATLGSDAAEAVVAGVGAGLTADPVTLATVGPTGADGLMWSLVPEAWRSVLHDALSVLSTHRVVVLSVVGSAAVFALVHTKSFELSQKPLDYRARLLRNPKNTLEEVLRVAAPAKAADAVHGWDDSALWGLNANELRGRVAELQAGSDINALVAQLHTSLARAGIGLGIGGRDGDREAAIKVGLTTFMTSWAALASESDRGRRVVDRMDFEDDDDWEAVRAFDMAVADGGEVATEPAVLLEQWQDTSVEGAGDAASIKARLQHDGAVLRLYQRLTSELSALAAANERDTLQAALHTLVGITELTLQRTTALDLARTYWLTEEASYHAQRQWYGGRTDDVRWLLGYPTSSKIAAALQWLKAQEVEALTFIGRVKAMMSSFPAIHFDAGASAAGRVGFTVSLLDNPALVQYRRRVHWLLVYSKNFLLHCLASGHDDVSVGDGIGIGGVGVGGGFRDSATPPQGSDMPPSAASSPVASARRASSVSSSDVLTQASEALRYQRLIGAEGGPVQTLRHVRAPTWLERNRISVAVATVVGLQAAYVLYTYSSYNGSTVLADLIDKARATAYTFVSEHLIEPVQNIAEYVIRRRRRSIAADPGAYEEARETLQRMLEDFINDQGSTLTVNKRAELMVYAQACDLRAINSHLLHEVRSPLRSLLGGEIVRLLLINAERMKVDMLLALNSMDELMRENTTTIEMAAMVPIIAVGALCVFFARWLLGETSKSRIHRHRLRMMLQELERTVIRQSSHDRHTLAAHRHLRSVSHADLIGVPIAPPLTPRQSRRRFKSSADVNSGAVPGAARMPPGSRLHQVGEFAIVEEEEQGNSGEESDGANASYNDDAFSRRALDEAREGSPEAYVAGDPSRRSSQPYFDLGQLIFAVWMVEHELRSHPNLLNRAKQYKVPLFSSLGTFVGAVAGVMVGGEGRNSAAGAAVGCLSGYLLAHRMLEDTRLITFDTERFLTDIHELPSPWLEAEQKVTWIAYLWRFYDLARVLDPSA